MFSFEMDEIAKLDHGVLLPKGKPLNFRPIQNVMV